MIRYARSWFAYIKSRLLPFSMTEKLEAGVYADPPYVDGEEDDVKRPGGICRWARKSSHCYRCGEHWHSRTIQCWEMRWLL